MIQTLLIAAIIIALAIKLFWEFRRKCVLAYLEKLCPSVDKTILWQVHKEIIQDARNGKLKSNSEEFSDEEVTAAVLEKVKRLTEK